MKTTPMDHMIEEIQADTLRTAACTGIDRIGKRTIDALRSISRETFVPEHNRSLAYANHPLPIGHGQTISQPFIVAIMTEMLRTGPQQRILELGTGCGYQTAVLSRLADEVHSIEIIPELAEQARERLACLGYRNAHVYNRDGAFGQPEKAPYHGIIVTAAASEIPPLLIKQLAVDGRLVMPLGEPAAFQDLIVYSQRTAAIRRLLPVRFVPLT